MAAPSIVLSDVPRPGRPVTVTYSAGGATVIALRGSLQGAGFALLDGLVAEALDQGHRHLVLDLDELRSLDPEAMGLLWAALRGVRRKGGTLAVARARPSLRPALEALNSGGLARHETVGDALSTVHHSDART